MTRIVTVFCFLLVFGLSYGQSVRHVLNRDSILIGEPIELAVYVENPLSEKVVFPQIKDSLNSKIEVLKSSIDTLEKDKRYVLKLTLTSFESGPHLYVGLPIIIGDSKFTSVFGFAAHEVLVDPEKGPKDIKEIYLEKFTFLEKINQIWPLVLLLILLLLAALWWFFYRKAKQKNPVRNKVLTPAEEALQSLKELDALNYLSQDKIKEQYYALDKIYRIFLNKHHKIFTKPFVSKQLFAYIKQHQILVGEDLEKFKKFLDQADSAKFAKAKLDPITNQENRLFIQKIIEDTQILNFHQDD
ncbi:MAG: hypothetical protein C4K58_00780 [Flavobacteriaceae bacterium]|nr:MAG: hypothetical protein C4K58_00780 [Flavobacteriaceae bacterium]